jgi:glycosyltransferase involved in cell wall biosynthesis
MPRVSCIIPVYNEGPRIANVLGSVTGHPLVNEIIVVDDASTDTTHEKLQAYSGITLLRHTENKGKTQALLTGLRAAKNELIFLLDADLVGLTAEDVNDLINPVLSGAADSSISTRKNSPWIDRVIGIDIFSGDRVFSRSLIQDQLEAIARLPRFGFESFLNKLIIKNRLRLKIVFWKNVISPWKYKKRGLWNGILDDVSMIADISKTISPLTVAYQFIKLRSQSV